MNSIMFLLVVVMLTSAQWVAKTPMPTRRSDLTATYSSTEGVIVVIGGCADDQNCPPGEACVCVELTGASEGYTPTTDTWTSYPDAPRHRFRHAAAELDGKVYVIGGRNLTDHLIAEIDVFDIGSQSWSTHATATSTPTSDHTAFTIGDSIYVVGGYNGAYSTLRTTWKFDPIAGTYEAVGNMNTGRGDFSSVVINGKGYVFGGFSESNFCDPLSTLEEFLPATSTWALKANMGVNRGDKAAAAVNGKLYAIGGEKPLNTTNCFDSFNNVLRDCESYDPVPDIWTASTDLPDFRFRFAAAGVDDTIFVFGGQEDYQATGGIFPTVATVEALTVTGGTTTSGTGATTTSSTTGSTSTTGDTSSAAALLPAAICLSILLVGM